MTKEKEKFYNGRFVRQFLTEPDLPHDSWVTQTVIVNPHPSSPLLAIVVSTSQDTQNIQLVPREENDTFRLKKFLKGSYDYLHEDTRDWLRHVIEKRRLPGIQTITADIPAYDSNIFPFCREELVTKKMPLEVAQLLTNQLLTGDYGLDKQIANIIVMAISNRSPFMNPIDYELITGLDDNLDDYANRTATKTGSIGL